MRYYAATNRYGSSTSMGFANTWCIIVFDSKASRDTYVHESPDISTRAIKRSEVASYLRLRDNTPRSFSGEYWGIDTDPYQPGIADGAIGYIVLYRPDPCYEMERLYKR